MIDSEKQQQSLEKNISLAPTAYNTLSESVREDQSAPVTKKVQVHCLLVAPNSKMTSTASLTL